ncbi:brain protein I3-like [Eriocheir sinensis]|uniref:brain protein I3-like n=1 Tax=Eriocheir sinensis TaxID=95602 RepID=UPI0021C8B08C|nr:brain protein I3-like [Eriocheir sinensis]XP_050708427.1 brain protein I3-like [Eriocheir sinensis]
MDTSPPPYSDAPSKPPPYSPESGAPGLSTPPPPVGFQVSSPQATVTTTTVVSAPPPPTQVVLVQSTWSCPACKQMGFVHEEFTMCGICLAICFFPLGLICCFMMRRRRCSNCRAIIL